LTKNTGFKRFDEYDSYPVYFQGRVLVLGIVGFIRAIASLKLKILARHRSAAKN
jgi:hypothetical protein